MKIRGCEGGKNTAKGVCVRPISFSPCLSFLSLISQLMVTCLLAVIGLIPSPSTEQIGVPLVTVAMTTAGIPATGGKFAFHGMDWPHCSVYTGRGILRFSGTQRYKHRPQISCAFVQCSGMRCEWHLCKSEVIQLFVIQRQHHTAIEKLQPHLKFMIYHFTKKNQLFQNNPVLQKPCN